MPGGVDLEQVQGFVFVGSGALVLLGVAVLVVGLVGRPGRPRPWASSGSLAYLVYLLVATVLLDPGGTARPGEAARLGSAGRPVRLPSAAAAVRS